MATKNYRFISATGKPQDVLYWKNLFYEWGVNRQFIEEGLDEIKIGLAGTINPGETKTTSNVAVVNFDNKFSIALSRISKFEVIVQRSTTTITAQPGIYGGQAGEIAYAQDHTIKLLKAGTPVGANKAKTTKWYTLTLTNQGPWTQKLTWSSETYSWTQAELIAAGLSDLDMNDTLFGFMFKQKLVNTGTLAQLQEGHLGDNYLPKITDIYVKITYDQGGGGGGTGGNKAKKFFLTDLCGAPVETSRNVKINEFLTKGDEVQVGNANALEDALRFVFQATGMQEVDATRPFYYDIEKCSIDVNVPPLRNDIFKNVHWNEVLSDIMQSAPPNYVIIQNRDGSISVKEINLQMPERYEVNHIYDVAEDATATGVSTRVVAMGEGGESVNVALHKDFGGQAAVRAYKLTNFSKADTPTGETKTQANANLTISQIFDASPRTPFVSDDAHRWGVVYEAYGSNIRRWTFEDEDLFVVDLGRNDYVDPSTQFDIDALQVSTYNTFIEGGGITQSLSVYGMTEEDYIREYGEDPPAKPDQGDADKATSYMPLATARSWRLLVDEFNTPEGQTTVESSDFISEKSVSIRFIKFRCTQAHHRLPNKNQNIQASSKICLPDIKVWTSRSIIATSELGYSKPFNDDPAKAIASRIRRRTVLLPFNPYLNTYDRAKTFSNNELVERSTDFSPVAASVIFPLLQAGDIIKSGNVNVPQVFQDSDGNFRKYIVKSVGHTSDGTCKLVLINYDIDKI